MTKTKINFFTKINATLSSGAKRGLVLMAVMVLVSAFLETAVVAMVVPFMSGILEPDVLFSNIWVQRIYAFTGFESRTSFLVALAFAMSALFLFKGCFVFFYNRFLYRFSSSTQESLGKILFRRFLFADYSELTRINTSHITNLLTGVCHQIMRLLTYGIHLVTEAIIILSLMAFMIYLDPIITMIGGGAVVTVMFFTGNLIKTKSYRAGQELNIRAVARIKVINQTFGGIKEIKVNKREGLFTGQFDEATRGYVRAAATNDFYASMPKVIIENGCMAMVFVGLGFIIFFSGDLSPMLPSLAAFGFSAVRLLPAANRLLISYGQFSNCLPALDLIYAELCGVRGPESRGGQDNEKVKGPVPVRPLETGIELKNVSFGFSGGMDYLFENINLHIPANRSVAFIGVTGSGKTTLADIILGLRRISSGTVKADGRDIKENSSWWASMVGYIPQHVYLCDDTIRANVAFGLPENLIDEEMVWNALRDAQMADFVSGLQEGLYTRIGENGIRLSGGQRQRIGIARALYLKPQFLVMDEGTSSLDNDTEQAIIEAINKLSGKITMLIIAHRMSTIKYCDFIYRVEDGKVVLENPD